MVAAAASRYYCPECGSRLRDLPALELDRGVAECDKCMCTWSITTKTSGTMTFARIEPSDMHGPE
jgi:hypothetical protein